MSIKLTISDFSTVTSDESDICQGFSFSLNFYNGYLHVSDVQEKLKYLAKMLYPDSGISMDEEFVLGDMIWSYNKAEL